jgi:hypothetical protein
MSEPIGPGDWVECIGAFVNPFFVVGRLYQAERVVPAIGDCPACGDETGRGLLFVGGPRIHHPVVGVMSCCPCRFRPVYRPRADFIESLKAPPERVGEFA